MSNNALGHKMMKQGKGAFHLPSCRLLVAKKVRLSKLTGGGQDFRYLELVRLDRPAEMRIYRIIRSRVFKEFPDGLWR